MNASGFWQTMALVVCAAASCFAEPLWQNRCTVSHEWDVLWDGVDRNGNLHVYGGGERILVRGMFEDNKGFGSSACWADVTGDGKPDLVVGDGWGFLWVYQAIGGTNAFPPQFTTGIYARTFVGSCVVIDVADFDEDGLNDVLVGSPEGVVTIMENLGSGRFTKSDGLPTVIGFDGYRLVSREPERTFPVAMAGKTPVCIGCFSAARYVDWDRDGKKDLVIGEGSYSANSIYLYLNRTGNKSPDFDGKREYLAYGMGREHLTPTVGDLDGDGDLDILTGEREGFLTWFENVPRPKDVLAGEAPFLLEPKAEQVKVGGQDKPTGEFSRPCLADVDGDGDLDLLFGCSDGLIRASRNSGTKKVPVFDAPVVLKGKDVLPPRREVSRWGLHRGNEGNSGVAFESLSEIGEDRDTSNMYFKYYFFNNYIGAGGHVEIGGPAKYEVQYSVSFRARGDNFRAIGCGYRQGREESVNGEGDVVESAEGFSESFEFNPSTQWTTFRKSIRLHRLTEAARKEKRVMTGFNYWISMVDPKPDAWLDITYFIVEQSSGVQREEDPSTNTLTSAMP